MRDRVASVTTGLVGAKGLASRSRMCVVFLTACLATAVGMLVGGPSVAFAASCSSGVVGSGFTTNNDRLNGALPAVGQTVSAGVEQVSSNANNNNGVQVHGGITLVSGSDTIGVGIRSMGDGLGPEWYAEKDNHTISSSVTFEGTFQPFSIKRTSTTGLHAFRGRRFVQRHCNVAWLEPRVDVLGLLETKREWDVSDDELLPEKHQSLEYQWHDRVRRRPRGAHGFDHGVRSHAVGVR